eukprot:5776040-Prymnesium_polylepis.1
MSGVCAPRCTTDPRLSVGLWRRGGASCPPSRPCTRTTHTAGERQRRRLGMSPRLADEKVGPQRSK